MKLARSWRVWCAIPILIVGYIETLRRATFESFGVVQQGTAFSLITVMIVATVVLEVYSKKNSLKITFKLVTFLYLMMVLYVNFLVGPVYRGAKLVFFNLPIINQDSAVVFNDMILFLVFIFYAVLIYLVVHYIFERKNITELAVGTGLLLGVEIATAQFDLSLWVILHVGFLLLLKSQLFCLYLTMDQDIEVVNESNYIKRWVGIAVIATFTLISIAMLLPTSGKGLDVAAEPIQWVKGHVIKKVNTLAKPTFNKQVLQEDSFKMYWDRLQQFNMEGKVEAADRLVMTVQSPKAFYWRGEAADYYTGSGWKNTGEISDINEGSSILINPYDPRIPVQEVEIKFTFSPDMVSNVIFIANVPKHVEVPGDIFWFDENDNYYGKELKPGGTYKIISYIPEFSDKQLRSAVFDNSSDKVSHYLQIPKNTPSRIKKKAEEITKGLTNSYDKAKAIEKYISEKFPYTLDIKNPPRNRDVVDYFLFDLKKGYCTYHSTAMAVMLRSIGIPCRWVKGFATGTYDSKTGTYLVKEGDAHAWVEVYFGKFGWIPFEPTASFNMPLNRSEPTSVNLEAVEQIVGREEKEKSNQNRVFQQKSIKTDMWPKTLKAINLFIIVMTFCMVLLKWWKIRVVQHSNRSSQARDYYINLIDLLETKGYTRAYNQTPYEFAGVLSEKYPDINKELILLTEGYLREHYGHHKFNGEQYEKLKQAWKKVVVVITGRSNG